MFKLRILYKNVKLRYLRKGITKERRIVIKNLAKRAAYISSARFELTPGELASF